MKISSFYKQQSNNNIILKLDYDNLDQFDKVFISKVFTDTETPDLSQHENIKIGGTGFFFDGGNDLPYEIEHSMPDYYLYDEFVAKQIQNGFKRNYFADYLDYSIGFATRGCFRKCNFCVNQKYDKVSRHAPISEFYDPSRKGIYLWDDNFLGYQKWNEVLDELEETHKPFQFRQGLDIRLMTEEKAKRLSSMKYKGDYIFAFDHLKDKELIMKKLSLWKRYCNKTTKLYVLCAYESQDINDIISTFERIKILMQYQCLPYIMRFNLYEESIFRGMYINLARWCNQPNFFKKKSFREYCEVNGERSSTMKYLREFEKDFPQVAKEYFDIRYDKGGII